MATLNPNKLKKNKNKKIKFFLIFVVVELMISPLLVFLVHQILTIVGSGTIDFSRLNYSYLDSLTALYTVKQLPLIFFVLQILLLAFWIYTTMRLEATIASIDTRYITPQIETPIPAGNGQHGKERFLTEEEKRELYNVFAFSGTENSLNTKGGIVVHHEKRGTKEIIYYIGKNLHTLIYGSSGSGKTRRILLVTMWLQILSGISIVTSDVKGEIYYFTHLLAELYGYKTYALDLRNPKKSIHYNFLQPILDALEEGDSAKAIDYTWDLVSVFVGEPKGEPLWTNGELATIAAGILIVALDAPRQYKNLTNVYYFIAFMCKPGELGKLPLNKYLEKLDDTHPAKGVFAMAEIAPHKTRSSFFTSALGTLKLFTNPNIAEMTSQSDINLKDISREKSILYMMIPDEKKTTYSLVSTLITQLYMMQVELANENGGKVPVETDYNLDEIGNFPFIPVLGNMISAGRSRGIRLNLIIQDDQQLESKYKDDFKNIKSNCQVKLYLKSDNPETLKRVSEALGKYTVEVSSASASVSENKRDNMNYSSSASLTGRPLLEQAEVGRIKEPYALCMITGEYAGINYLPDLSEYRLNKLYGLGDEQHNVTIIQKREAEREEHVITALNLWGIWKTYQDEAAAEATETENKRVSFLK